MARAARQARGNDQEFYLLFDIRDRSGNKVEGIARNLQSLTRVVREMGRASNHAANEDVPSLTHAMDNLAEVQQRMAHMGQRIRGALQGLATEAVHAASEFETIHTEINFAFGDGADAAWDRMTRFARESVYELSDITAAVASLRMAFQHIDPTLDDTAHRFQSRTGDMVSAMQAMSDTAAGSRQQLGDVIQEVERALEGNFRSLRYSARLSQHEVTQMQQGIARAADEQGRFDSIMRVLAVHWGGAQSAQANTWRFLVAQISDYRQQLMAAIGTPMMNRLKGIVRTLLEFLTGLMNNRRFIAEMAAAFDLLGRVLVGVAEGGFAVARAFVWVTSHVPGLGRMVLLLTALAGVAATATAGIGGMALVVGRLATGLAQIPQIIATVRTAVMAMYATLAPIAPIVLAIAAAAAVAYVAYRTNFLGIRTFVERVGLVITALSEAFENWHRGYVDLSEDTAHRLEQAGLLGFFSRLVAWLQRAQEWGEGVWKGLTDGWNSVRPELERAWADLQGAFTEVGNAVSQAMAAFTDAGTAGTRTFQGTRREGNAFGRTLSTFVIPMIRGVGYMMNALATIVRTVVVPAIQGIRFVINGIRTFINEHRTEFLAMWQTLAWLASTVIPLALWVLRTSLQNLTLPFRALGQVIRGLVNWAWLRREIHQTLEFLQRLIDGFHRLVDAMPGSLRRYLGISDRATEGISAGITSARRNAGMAPAPANGETPVDSGERDADVRPPPGQMDMTRPLDDLVTGNYGSDLNGEGGTRRLTPEEAALQRRQVDLQLQQLTATRSMLQQMQEGALRPVITEEELAGHVRNADASAGERAGFSRAPGWADTGRGG